MTPFLLSAGTSPQLTKMLVELVFCTWTLSGGAVGAVKNEIYSMNIIATVPPRRFNPVSGLLPSHFFATIAQ